MPKFQLGDNVHYTNGNGIYWGVYKIIGIELNCSYSKSGIGYYLENVDNPSWYAVKEESLKSLD